MSGGHFNYDQYRIAQIADEVEHLIETSGTNDWRGFSEATIEQFRKGLQALRIAEVYAQRIDWLVSGDDGEDSFHRRLADDLGKLEQTPGGFYVAALGSKA